MDKYKIKSPIGYLWLQQFLDNKGIKTYPYYRESYLLEKGNNRVVEKLNQTEYYYKQKNIKDDNLWNNVEFALKHEGINLEIFENLFEVLGKEVVQNYVKKKPNGKYNRIIWFLYEWLTEKNLDLKDIDTRNYIELLDSDLYYTSDPVNHKRYAIKENLLGNKYFCPFIRKTDRLNHYKNINLKEKALKVIANYNSSLIKRASSYLYFKETKSSNEIEREKPNQARLVRFVNILEKIDQLDKLSKEFLIEIQNTIVDPRYAQKDYRTWQNYVGETFGLEHQKIHYIAPKGEDVESLMKGLLECSERLLTSNLPPVVIAAILSFGFVFIHPFEDGNGRIHRFLIHYVLAKLNSTPEGV
ncbi:MAG: Fic family protein, partial [Cyanobacteriota bacterium]